MQTAFAFDSCCHIQSLLLTNSKRHTLVIWNINREYSQHKQSTYTNKVTTHERVELCVHYYIKQLWLYSPPWDFPRRQWLLLPFFWLKWLTSIMASEISATLVVSIIDLKWNLLQNERIVKTGKAITMWSSTPSAVEIKRATSCPPILLIQSGFTAECSCLTWPVWSHHSRWPFAALSRPLAEHKKKERM